MAAVVLMALRAARLVLVVTIVFCKVKLMMKCSPGRAEGGQIRTLRHDDYSIHQHERRKNAGDEKSDSY